MTWRVVYLPEAEDDFRSLDGSQRIMVRKALAKLQTNPLPAEKADMGGGWETTAAPNWQAS